MSLNEVIDLRAAEYRAEIAQMAKRASEWINRSAGQLVRQARERGERARGAHK